MRYTHTSILTIILLLCTLGDNLAQSEGESSLFIEPEWMVGKLVGNYSNYPKTSMRNTFAISVGKHQNTLKNSWAKYYNFPSTGVSMSISDLGNNDVFGQEFSVMPFLVLNTSKSHKKSWYLKLGLGTSYYNKSYAASPLNEAVGSKFTWSFQTFFYKNIKSTPSMNLKLGAGFLHGSNAHAQLPNFGINSAMVSLSAQWFRDKIDPDYAVSHTPEIDRERHYFIQTRTGLGYHEYGGTHLPIGGETRPVHSFSISGGIVFRNHIKVRTGFAYRYYAHYYEQILKTENPDFIDRPRWGSSNLFWFLGTELLLGHVGLNFEGGINIYKPYFEVYFAQHLNGSGFKEFIKTTFNSKMGLTLYLKNTNRNPKHNVFAGTNISTNFGQADFGEIAFGYVMRIK